MVKKAVLLAIAGAMLGPTTALGQDKVAFVIPNLFDSGGLFVDSEAPLPGGGTHSAHFSSAFQTEFTQFNVALATQLSPALPLPSPASGFTYTFDPAAGVFTRSTQSFGPIFAERAETLGRHRLTFGFTFQRFTFNTLDGDPLNEVPAVFTHDSPSAGGRADVVSTINDIEASVSQFTAVLTYGLTDRLDVSIGIPIVNTDLSVFSVATVQRLGTAGDPAVHFFEGGSGGFGTEREFFNAASATGIGDILIRLKGTAGQWNGTGFAGGVDVRLPTGDEEDLLGSGAPGFKPFAAVSFSLDRVSPHVNVGYQWNGDSVLAGDVTAGVEDDLGDQFFYVVGADLGVTDELTLAFDLLGQRLIDSPRFFIDTFTDPFGSGARFDDLGFDQESFNLTSGAVGLKVSAGGNLLVDFNLLFKLNDAGLRDTVTPLFGVEYSF